MEGTQLSDLTLATTRLVERTAAFIRGELGQLPPGAIEEKSRNSLVSYVDKTAEQQLVKGLRELLPTATFLTEAGTVAAASSDLQWIVDPLDGTTNFLYEIPIFSVSVGLQQKGELVLGVVYEVNRSECFYAWKGGGAFLNGRSIGVRQGPMEEALLATGFPYYDYGQMEAYFDVLKKLMSRSRGLRRLGSAAVDLAYVACGRFDGFFEYSLQPWDVAGGAIIVREAGGVVTDFFGGKNYLHGKQLLACSPVIQAEMLDLLGAAFR